jgi:glutathione S-transferase
MVLKIHHVPLARSTRPIWLYFELKELYEGSLPDLEIEYVDMNKFRVEKSVEYLARNPNGKVPLLEDTDRDVVLWESCAIVYYLLDLFDPEDRLVRLGEVL